MDDDRESLYSAMYASDGSRDPDDEQDSGPATSGVIQPSLSHVTIPVGLRASKIVTDEGTFSVPTLAYVGALERLLGEQARVIAELRSPGTALAKLERTVTEQGRSIRRLDHALNVMRNFMRRQTGRLGDMQTDLDAKIDRRD